MLTTTKIEELIRLIPVSTKAGIRPTFAELVPFLLEFITDYEQSKWIKFDANDENTCMG